MKTIRLKDHQNPNVPAGNEKKIKAFATRETLPNRHFAYMRGLDRVQKEITSNREKTHRSRNGGQTAHTSFEVQNKNEARAEAFAKMQTLNPNRIPR